MSINDEIKRLLESSKADTVASTDEVVEEITDLDESTMDRVSGAEGTKVKVHNPKVKHHGKKGEIIDSGRDGSFHVVKFKDGSSSSFQGSDLKKIDESEVEDTITVDVSEDVDALLNGEDLSEEFKTKAVTIFEAAVVTRVQSEVSKLVEAYANQLHEEVAQIKEGIADKVDGYLSLVVEQWMSDNEIALTQGIKSEIMENFLSGIKSVFEQNYIEVPEEKFDVLESMETRIAELESKLDETTEKNVQLNTEVNIMRKDIAISEACEGLTDTQMDKFVSLVEELSFEDEETFTEKLKTIRENYFVKPSTRKQLRETFITDEAIEEPEVKKIVDPAMSAYLNAIDRQSKI